MVAHEVLFSPGDPSHRREGGNSGGAAETAGNRIGRDANIFVPPQMTLRGNPTDR